VISCATFFGPGRIEPENLDGVRSPNPVVPQELASAGNRNAYSKASWVGGVPRATARGSSRAPA
jgi:hypothetical protein